MELEIMSFSIGALVGGGFFGFGLLIGLVANRDTFNRQVKDEEYDPKEEVVDDAFFEENWGSEGGFPVDAELEALHRHSNYEVNDAE